MFSVTTSAHLTGTARCDLETFAEFLALRIGRDYDFGGAVISGQSCLS